MAGDGAMRQDIGSTLWVIGEGYLPTGGLEGDRAFESHEAYCILNTGADDAEVELTLYFTDRDPVGPYRATVPARRVVHLRPNDLEDPEPVPRDTDFAVVISADRPVVVQHTRLDSRQKRFSLMTTTAYPGR